MAEVGFLSAKAVIRGRSGPAGRWGRFPVNVKDGALF